MIEYYCLNTWGDANRAWFNVRNIVVAALAGILLLGVTQAQRPWREYPGHPYEPGPHVPAIADTCPIPHARNPWIALLPTGTRY